MQDPLAQLISRKGLLQRFIEINPLNYLSAKKQATYKTTVYLPITELI